MTLTILYGFDAERPYGEFGADKKGRQQRETNLSIVEKINNVLNQANMGRTFFILGAYLDQSAEQLGVDHLKTAFSIGNPLVEIAQHTYTHPVIANIPTRPDKQPISAEELKNELERAEQSIVKHLGVKPQGLRTPLGYAKGLQTHPDVLDVLKTSGLSYVSSSLRDNNGGLNAPLVEDGLLRQPFRYANGLVEVPSHGWQDTSFTGTSKTQGTTSFPTDLEGIFEHYKTILTQGQRISEESGQDIFIGLCMHPWAIAKYDPELNTVQSLVELSQEKGYEGKKYSEVLNKF